MFIAIDMRSVSDKFCGVSRMAVNLARALAAIDKNNRYVLYTIHTGNAPIVTAANFTEKRIPITRYSLKDHFCFKEVVAKDMPDVFHSPHQYLPFFWDLPVKRLVTVCDLFASQYPWFFENRTYITKHIAMGYFNIMMRRTLHQADLIVAISQYTKDDICKKYYVPEKSVRVAHLAAGDQVMINNTRTNPEPAIELPKGPYCLFVGNFKRYKNIEGAIDAIAVFNKAHPKTKIRLVVAGNDEKNLQRVQAYARNLGVLENTIFMRYVTDATLTVLYRNALCLLFPSLYEGFGIPVLEAMKIGTPVVCSNTSSLPEVAGGAALLVDPSNPHDIASAINSVMINQSLREELINKGHKNDQRFSWEKTAQQYLEIYQELCNNR